MSLPDSSPAGDLREDASPPVERHAAGNGLASKMALSKSEALGIGVLGLMVVYFLASSWRKWPDPLVDFGQQCYCVWRVSQGALLYHDFLWSYGPFSIFFNAELFRCFGRGIMVLATANLVIYGFILALAYIAFRMAWGRLAAFAAMTVFISVFSFSHLLGVGNYNYATPYSGESVHGMLLILVTAFVVVRWCRGPSRKLAFLLGLCGGLAVVIKPEFMLAIGVLAIAAFALRWWQDQKVSVAEFSLLIGGGLIPTLAFTAWFARLESWKAAFIDASQAWWLVIVTHVQSDSAQQQTFTGLSHTASNALWELKAAFWALVVTAAIWVAGWCVNRSWSVMMRVIITVAAGVLVCFVRLHGGWMEVGRCLPGLMVLVLIVVGSRVWREVKANGRAGQGSIMALVLVLLAGTMLARMPLFARIYHLGFFQAALAAMVVAAAMVAELPRWTGTGEWGRRVAIAGGMAVLAIGCGSIASVSREHRADQTQAVGWGRDLFYATTPEIDRSGLLIDWASECLRPVPLDATVLVLPEGSMINYLSQHKTVEQFTSRGEGEAAYIEHLRHYPPDYVVLITRNMTDVGIARWGAPGNFGHEIVEWIMANYEAQAHAGGDPLKLNEYQGAIIFRKKQG